MVTTSLQNETILFAKEELEKYLALLDKNIPVNFQIHLELIEQADVEKDTVKIHVNKNGGVLSGSNPRSVLYAVYRYVEALGVRWVRHGEDGEYIPENVSVTDHEIHLESIAKNKHRGMCIEGAVSVENVLDNISWAAKMGFNTYFLQFIIPYTFFDRWYGHHWNPTKQGRKLTNEEVIEFKKRVVAEIKKRGMLFHAVGHGWTCIPFGLPGEGGWTEMKEEPADDIRNILAEVNGKREFWKGIPMNTELCYSNAEVRRKMVTCCADYISDHPEIDVVHLWLSDGSQNHCECENCRKKIPSDHYIILLNELDSELTKRNLNTKIVFLLYNELMWAPETETLQNPDRFLMMFAPICRRYETSYADLGALPEIAPYERNKMERLIDVESNVVHLNSWRKVCAPEGFSFEYYYWLGEHYRDFGSVNLARIIYEDICNLEKIGLSGIVSCQSQRAFMPSGLGSYVMAKTLWDDTIPFGALVDAYFEASFGKMDECFKAHLMNLSRIAKFADMKQKFTRLKEASEHILTKIDNIRAAHAPLSLCHAKSVDYIEFHCEFMIMNAVAELALLEKGVQGSEKEWRDLARFVQENEDRYQPVLDLTQIFSDLLGRRHYELVELQLVND